MTPFYLIYHPARKITIAGNLVIHHDKFGGNEDPYLWNDKFLHTYCHITQLSNVVDQTNFWISGDTYPNFTQLFCDCVFVIKEKHFWTTTNFIDRNDPIVDNDQTFEHHYKWPNYGHHHFLKKQRYTLKADPRKSFQPQDGNGNLVDVLPFLNKNGLTTKRLIRLITSRRGSRPLRLDDQIGLKLYTYLVATATKKVFGRQIKNKHPNKQITIIKGC